MTDMFQSGEPSTGYPEFPAVLTDEELGVFFHLGEADLRLVNNKRRDHNRLGFALQLTTPRYLGRFLSDPTQVPASVVAHVADQLDIDEPLTVLQQYGERDGTARTHAAEIRRAHDWKHFDDHQTALADVLNSRAWDTEGGPQALLLHAVTWLRRRKILLPARTPLQELVATARRSAEDKMYAKLDEALTDPQRSRLDKLLHSPSHLEALDRLRTSPKHATWESLAKALERARQVRQLAFTEVDVSDVPHWRLAHLARYGFRAKPSRRQALQRPRQRAVILATVKFLESASIDDALDILNTLIANEFLGKARRQTNKRKLASYDALLRAAARLLAFVNDLREAAVERVDTSTGEITEPAASPRQLHELIETLAHRPGLDPDLDEAIAALTALVPAPDSDADEARRAAMLDNFSTLKTHLPAVIQTVAFHAAPESKPLLWALRSLPALLNQGTALHIASIDETLLAGSWRKLALHNPDLPDHAVDARAYAFCIVEAFHDHLRGREIFAPDARKWGDPQGGRISDELWERKKTELLDSVGLPADPSEHLSALQRVLEAELHTVASRLPSDHDVELGPGAQLVFHKLPPVPVPASLRNLRREISRRMPQGDLPELLLEVFKWTSGKQAFTSLSGTAARAPHLDTTLSAVLVAHGCNVGIEPVSGNGKGLSDAQIQHVDREYCRADTYDAFNALMLDFQKQIDLAQTLGGGQLATVDGMRFIVPRTQIPARLAPNGDPEVTWLTLVSDQAIQLSGKVLAGTADKCLYVLDAVYERHTRLDHGATSQTLDSGHPPTIVAETGDHEDIAFGLLSLSGYAYAPVPRHLAKTKLWRIDTAADYGPLNRATQGRIDLGLIARNWDDILRLICSIHSGKTRAQDALRILIRKGRISSLGQAIVHYGRIMKTRHLLALFDDPDFRRKIETQSAHHEARHQLAEKIFHGNAGQVHRYHAGMEESLGALGLVLNAVVLFNTFYMDQIIKRMRERGLPVFAQDVAQISLYAHQHINMKGRYAFELPDLPDGQMRSLPEPDGPDADVPDDL